MSPQTAEKFQSIRLLLLDVDGVLTDGSITYNDAGIETKTFDVKDGFGIRLLMDHNIQVGIVTGRASDALRHRCDNLGIRLLFDGVQDKARALDRIMGQTGLAAFEIAFIGDDLPDLPIMRRVGLSIAVADAVPYVCEQADFVTTKRGGKGAVREICETILRAKGLWSGILDT